MIPLRGYMYLSQSRRLIGWLTSMGRAASILRPHWVLSQLLVWAEEEGAATASGGGAPYSVAVAVAAAGCRC